jgi:hypothetical protein
VVQGPLPGWDLVEAGSIEQARHVQQQNPCDVLLLDGSLVPAGDWSGLRWLTARQPTPVLFLSDAAPEILTASFAHGVTH